MRIHIYLAYALLCCILSSTVQAQIDDPTPISAKKKNAYYHINTLKDSGAIILRLDGNEKKIQYLERSLKNPKMRKKKRVRIEGILKNTIEQRDKINKALFTMFRDSFDFCSVYFMYDKHSRALINGEREGIFNTTLEGGIDTTIEFREREVFLVDYQKSGGRFPFDVLLVSRLNERLDDPFPYYIQLRKSWLDDLNLRGTMKAVLRLERRLERLYLRAQKAKKEEE